MQGPVKFVLDIDGALVRFAFELGTNLVWDIEERMAMKFSDACLIFGRTLMRELAGHPCRLVLRSSEIGFDPACTPGGLIVNLWGGMPLEPKDGDCTAILELFDLLLRNAPELRDFVLNWLALPLQNPGTKLASALVVHGPQGSGKNLFFERVMGAIYGPYFSIVGNPQLESRYNDWLFKKTFLLGNEVVAGNELQHSKNTLKSLITEETIQIETKYLPTRSERNYVNVVFLSNDTRPLAAERDDRRLAVVYTPAKREKELYDRVAASLKTGGVEAFYSFLLSRDLKDFHAHTQPPMTSAKAELVELGLRPAQRFARDWLTGLIDLPLHPCSTQQLYTAFTRWCRANGERIPPNQSIFSAEVLRYAGDALERKTASPSPGEAGVTIRFWLPLGTGPKDGARWYDFAVEALAAFDQRLQTYQRNPGDAP